MSRSGVLFRTDCPLEPNTAIQMSLILPVSMIESGRPGKVFCRGTVVRKEPANETTSAAVAASIRSYRFPRRHGESLTASRRLET